MVFVDRSINNQKLFREIVCAIGLGHTKLPSNLDCFAGNYSLSSLQSRNFYTSNDLQYTVHNTAYT